MEIIYSKAMRPFCKNDFCGLQRKVGKQLARDIKKKIEVLQAFNNFNDYLLSRIGKPHSLEGRMGCYGVSLTGNVRMIVCPVSESLSAEDLKKCEIVEIEGVCDYHGAKTSSIIP